MGAAKRPSRRHRPKSRFRDPRLPAQPRSGNAGDASRHDRAFRRSASNATSANCAVRPLRALSIRTAWVRPTCAARWRATAASPAARNRAARDLIVRPSTAGIRAAGVPVRGEYGKTWQPSEIALLDQPQRFLEMRLGLGRETGDDVGPEGHVGAQAAGLPREANRVAAQMPALHALEDHVGPVLEAEVKVRHQPRFLGDAAQERLVHLDAVDAADPQARHVRQPQDPRDEIAQGGVPGRSAPQEVRSTPVKTISLKPRVTSRAI